MTMSKCNICAELNVGPDHYVSEKHIRNRLLYDYALNQKQFCGNKNGVEVSCSVRSSLTQVFNCENGKINISVKPDEEIKFLFCVKNGNESEKVLVTSIQLAHNKLNFIMNSLGQDLGSNPLILKPKQIMQKELLVTFKSLNKGQYEMPIIFCFRKQTTEETFIIIRDMVAYVEDKLTTHSADPSPYDLQDVTADMLFKTKNRRRRGYDMFLIPTEFKAAYASGLKVKKDATPGERAIADKIRTTLEAGVSEHNYEDYFHHLLWWEETMVRINLKKYNMSKVPLKDEGYNTFALRVPGLAEKRPSLMKGDLLFIKPHKDDSVMFEATVLELKDHNTVSIGNLDDAFWNYYNDSAMFDVRFFMSRVPLERMHRAVRTAATTAADMKRVFPTANCQVVDIKPIDKFFNPLIAGNKEQAEAVARIVSGNHGAAPYLLHGPPGTGKTITIVEAILQLVKADPNNRIMVCTDSNMAADHVATVLIQYADLFDNKFLLRVNSEFRVWETLPKSLHKYSNGKSSRTHTSMSVKDLKEYNIVVCTLSHAAKYARESAGSRPISQLFIDEAAQASEPACLVPLAGLLAPRGRVVLGGDPRQLGPVVISHQARRLGLGLSLMERLMNTCSLYSNEGKDPNYTLMLRNNFRSNADILMIPNQLFYEGQLRAFSREDPLSQIDILGERRHSRAVVFHGVLSTEEKIGKSPSFFNSMELELVQMYISCLINDHKVRPEDIGVVTPYIRQAYKIKRWLDKQMYPGVVEVGTVEAFQGKEKRVVVVSTVRANCNLLDHDAKFQLGFLVEDKRFNVALTRAKAKVIIIGNPLCLEIDVKWRTYMQQCREYDTYFGYDPLKDDTGGARNDIAQMIIPLLKDIKV